MSKSQSFRYSSINKAVDRRAYYTSNVSPFRDRIEKEYRIIELRKKYDGMNLFSRKMQKAAKGVSGRKMSIPQNIRETVCDMRSKGMRYCDIAKEIGIHAGSVRFICLKNKK